MPLIPTDVEVIARNVRAASDVLAHAEEAGLPMPYSVSVTELGPTTLQFASLVELTEWSRWTEQPITDEPGPRGIHHYVHATELDHPIRCVAITGGAR